jgi:hypothetical protein
LEKTSTCADADVAEPVSKIIVPITGDREFESTLLQRRVMSQPCGMPEMDRRSLEDAVPFHGGTGRLRSLGKVRPSGACATPAGCSLTRLAFNTSSYK